MVLLELDKEKQALKNTQQFKAWNGGRNNFRFSKLETFFFDK